MNFAVSRCSHIEWAGASSGMCSCICMSDDCMTTVLIGSPPPHSWHRPPDQRNVTISASPGDGMRRPAP
eukprot:366260-Chlamydomonas_euryale.AAC.29